MAEVYVEFKTACGCTRCMILGEYPGTTYELPLEGTWSPAVVSVMLGELAPLSVRVRRFEHVRDRWATVPEGDGAVPVRVHVYEEDLEEDRARGTLARIRNLLRES